MCIAVSMRKEGKKEGRRRKRSWVSLSSSVPSLLAILPCTQAASLAVVCLSEIWTWMHRAAAHSTHSSVVHPLHLDVEQIDLGVDYSRGMFHNFWLALLHLPLLFSLCASGSFCLTPMSSCGSAGCSWRRPAGRVATSNCSLKAFHAARCWLRWLWAQFVNHILPSCVELHFSPCFSYFITPV